MKWQPRGPFVGKRWQHVKGCRLAYKLFWTAENNRVNRVEKFDDKNQVWGVVYEKENI